MMCVYTCVFVCVHTRVRGCTCPLWGQAGDRLSLPGSWAIEPAKESQRPYQLQLTLEAPEFWFNC